MMKDMRYIMVLLLELILFPVWQTFKYVKYPYFQNRCFYNILQVLGKSGKDVMLLLFARLIRFTE